MTLGTSSAAVARLGILDSGSLTHYNGAPNNSLVRNNKPN
jgi:hypothetical protein